MLGVTVTSLSPGSALLAFLAGLVSFASPCVLPLLPAYLSFLSGVDVQDLDRRRRRVLPVALLFVLGFTAVFVAMGAGAGGLGGLLTRHQEVLQVAAGVFLVVAGLVVAGVITLPEKAVGLSPRARGAGGAFVAGAAMAIAWTPCVGYVLGAILTLAGSSESAWQGAALLLVYSAGLGVPFVLAGVAFGWLSRRLAVVKRHYGAVRVVAGAVLVVFGVFVAFGWIGELSARLPGLDVGL